MQLKVNVKPFKENSLHRCDGCFRNEINMLKRDVSPYIPEEDLAEQKNISISPVRRFRYARDPSDGHFTFHSKDDYLCNDPRKSLESDTETQERQSAGESISLAEKDFSPTEVEKLSIQEDTQDFCTTNLGWNKLDSLQAEGSNDVFKSDSEISNIETISEDGNSLAEHRNRQHKCPNRARHDSDCANRLIPDGKCEINAPQIRVHESPYHHTYEQHSFCDATVIFTVEDTNQVIEFAHFVKSLVMYELKFEPILEFFDVEKADIKMSDVEKILNRSAVVFVFLTENTNSFKMQSVIDEAIALSRFGVNQKFVMTDRWPTDRQSILKPVHTLNPSMRTYKTCAGFVSYQGIDWFNKFSQHTCNCITSTMKEAYRIRRELESKDLGMSTQPQPSFPCDNGDHIAKGSNVLVQHTPQQWQPFFQSKLRLKGRLPVLGSMPGNTYQPPKILPNRNIKVKFRPSERICRPPSIHQYSRERDSPPMYSSSIPSGDQPPSYQTSQNNYRQRPSLKNDATKYNHEPCRVSNSSSELRSRLSQPKVQCANERQQNRPNVKIASSMNQMTNYASPDEGRSNRARLSDRRRINGRQIRTDLLSEQTINNDTESSGSSESSFSDDSDDASPPKYKNKRRINVMGCKYVQIGRDNKVLGIPRVSKKQSSEISKVKSDEQEDKDNVRAWPETSIKQKEKILRRDTTDFPAHRARSHTVQSHRSSYSVLEDNLDSSHINLPCDASKTKDKNLADLIVPLDDTAEPQILNVRMEKLNDTILHTGAKSTHTYNVSPGECEVSLIANETNEFDNDLNKCEESDKVTSCQTVSGTNICFTSSDEENDVLLERQQERENEIQQSSRHKTDCHRSGELKYLSRNIDEKSPTITQNKSLMQFCGRRSIDFLQAIDTLKIITQPTPSGSSQFVCFDLPIVDDDEVE